MLTQKQIREIREHLERAQNPVFFFDNDADGLCSFLLFRRWLGRGKGVAIKSFPELTGDYFRKVHELEADYIFILDKPLVSGEFFKKAEEINIPVVWIDHHFIDREIPDFVSYYNPIFNRRNESEPVTYLCHRITNRKEDLWIAVVGCISDKFLPDFYQDFKELYPEISCEGEAFDVLYQSQIGKIARMFNFALKDRTGNVTRMLNFSITARSPYDILEEKGANRQMHKRFEEVNKRLKKLFLKAESKDGKKFLFFKYSGNLSVSSDLANELCYSFPGKIIVVVYLNGSKANISIRGKNAKKIISKVVEKLENATGGGHDEAAGARINSGDVAKFRKILKEIIEENL